MGDLEKTVLFCIIGYVILIVIIVSMRISIAEQNKEITYLKHKIIKLESYYKADSIINEMDRKYDMEYREDRMMEEPGRR